MKALGCLIHDWDTVDLSAYPCREIHFFHFAFRFPFSSVFPKIRYGSVNQIFANANTESTNDCDLHFMYSSAFVCQAWFGCWPQRRTTCWAFIILVTSINSNHVALSTACLQTAPQGFCDLQDRNTFSYSSWLQN